MEHVLLKLRRLGRFTSAESRRRSQISGSPRSRIPHRGLEFVVASRPQVQAISRLLRI